MSSDPSHEKDPALSAPEVAAVVHDVRQMLSVITGRAGLLLERALDPDTAAHLRTMELAARDAATMLGRLGGAAAQSGQADLSEAATAAAVMSLPPDTCPGLTVEIAVPPGLVVAVPGQVLREVLNNLLFNCVAAMPDGGQVALTGAQEGDRVTLRVSDTGPGIDPALRDRIFEAGVSRSGEPGRGIGLAACRSLLAAYRADLDLLETSATGTVFVLDLPVGDPQATGETASLALAGAPLSVLVVDDESAMREMMTDLLRELGCRVTVAADGPATRRALAEEAFQVAFLDQNLPGQSGVEIASWIRGAFPATFLVLVTGWGNDQLLQNAPEGLLDAAVEKPLTVGIIRDLLRLGLDQMGR